MKFRVVVVAIIYIILISDLSLLGIKGDKIYEKSVDPDNGKLIMKINDEMLERLADYCDFKFSTRNKLSEAHDKGKFHELLFSELDELKKKAAVSSSLTIENILPSLINNKSQATQWALCIAALLLYIEDKKKSIFIDLSHKIFNDYLGLVNSKNFSAVDRQMFAIMSAFFQFYGHYTKYDHPLKEIEWPPVKPKSIISHQSSDFLNEEVSLEAKKCDIDSLGMLVNFRDIYTLFNSRSPFSGDCDDYFIAMEVRNTLFDIERFEMPREVKDPFISGHRFRKIFDIFGIDPSVTYQIYEESVLKKSIVDFVNRKTTFLQKMEQTGMGNAFETIDQSFKSICSEKNRFCRVFVDQWKFNFAAMDNFTRDESLSNLTFTNVKYYQSIFENIIIFDFSDWLDFQKWFSSTFTLMIQFYPINDADTRAISPLIPVKLKRMDDSLDYFKSSLENLQHCSDCDRGYTFDNILNKVCARKDFVSIDQAMLILAHFFGVISRNDPLFFDLNAISITVKNISSIKILRNPPDTEIFKMFKPLKEVKSDLSFGDFLEFSLENLLGIYNNENLNILSTILTISMSLFEYKWYKSRNWGGIPERKPEKRLPNLFNYLTHFIAAFQLYRLPGDDKPNVLGGNLLVSIWIYLKSDQSKPTEISFRMKAILEAFFNIVIKVGADKIPGIEKFSDDLRHQKYKNFAFKIFQKAVNFSRDQHVADNKKSVSNQLEMKLLKIRELETQNAELKQKEKDQKVSLKNYTEELGTIEEANQVKNNWETLKKRKYRELLSSLEQSILKIITSKQSWSMNDTNITYLPNDLAQQEDTIEDLQKLLKSQEELETQHLVDISNLKEQNNVLEEMLKESKHQCEILNNRVSENSKKKVKLIDAGTLINEIINILGNNDNFKNITSYRMKIFYIKMTLKGLIDPFKFLVGNTHDSYDLSKKISNLRKIINNIIDFADEIEKNSSKDKISSVSKEKI